MSYKIPVKDISHNLTVNYNKFLDVSKVKSK